MRHSTNFEEAYVIAGQHIDVATADQEDRGVLESGWVETIPPIQDVTADRLKAAFRVMDVMKLEPEVVFYPVGLSTRTWADILTNHRTPDGEASEGIRPHPVEQMQDKDDSEAKSAKRWGIAVVCGKNALTALDCEMSLANMSEDLIGGASCSLEQYYALQWKRLFQEREPVDRRYTTLIVAASPHRCVRWDDRKHSITTSPAPPVGLHGYNTLGHRLAFNISP